MKDLSPAQRLIIAADFLPASEGGRTELYTRNLQFGASLKGATPVIKINSLLRAIGYNAIDELHRNGFGVFADLKLFDIGETLATDGKLLRESKPEFLTVTSFAGVEALKRLKAELPDTKVLGVSILTTLTEDDTHSMFGCSVREGALRFGDAALVHAGLDGLICAPGELEMLRKEFGNEPWLISPNIRYADGIVAGDDQNPRRAMSPAQAIQAGADCIVMGRPITQAVDPLEAIKKAFDEIESVTT